MKKTREERVKVACASSYLFTSSIYPLAYWFFKFTTATKIMTRGGSITPSARRSIHSHHNCPFGYMEAMGRHGIVSNRRADGANRSTEDEVNRSVEHGTDEVDNAFSKPVHPIDLSSFNHRNTHRRKSMTIDEVHTEDSDDSDEYRPEREEAHNSASYPTPFTNRSPSANRKTANNRSASFIIASQNAENWEHSLAQKKTKNYSKIMITIISLFVALATIFMTKFSTTNVANNVIYDESRFCNDIDHLGSKYNINENSVLQMQTGITTIFERQDTGSFMFVYNSNDDHFNPKTFNNFVNDVSVTASKYLRNDSVPVHYTTVEGTQLEMNEHCDLIDRFREDLARTGVMLVKHIEAIPSTLAMAFHYYCDEYNPLVKKSAIFFTLNLAKCDKTDNKSTHAMIEKCLAKKWSGVPSDSIGPLLTRVVNVVIDVTSVF